MNHGFKNRRKPVDIFVKTKKLFQISFCGSSKIHRLQFKKSKIENSKTEKQVIDGGKLNKDKKQINLLFFIQYLNFE
jgi:hypothetical protein